MKVIATFTTPKQRMTRPYSIVLMDNPQKEQSEAYSTHVVYNDKLGGKSAGHYDLSLEKAWEDFKSRVNDALTYGPETWEKPVACPVGNDNV